MELVYEVGFEVGFNDVSRKVQVKITVVADCGSRSRGASLATEHKIHLADVLLHRVGQYHIAQVGEGLGDDLVALDSADSVDRIPLYEKGNHRNSEIVLQGDIGCDLPLEFASQDEVALLGGYVFEYFLE